MQCSEQSPPGKFFEVYELDQSMRHGHTNWIIQLREEPWDRMVWWSCPSLSKGATKCFVANGHLYVTNIQDMATTDGAQQTWPPWTSESDISRQTLKRSGPGGPPGPPYGPSTMYKAHTCKDALYGQFVRRGH